MNALSAVSHFLRSTCLMFCPTVVVLRTIWSLIWLDGFKLKFWVVCLTACMRSCVTFCWKLLSCVESMAHCMRELISTTCSRLSALHPDPMINRFPALRSMSQSPYVSWIALAVTLRMLSISWRATWSPFDSSA